MRLLMKVAGIGLFALLLSAGLISVPGGNHPGAAYAGGSYLSDPARTGDVTPTAGDPDGPTGDVAPPTHGTGDGPVTVYEPPVRRMHAWAQWTLAFKTWLRFTIAR